MPLLVHGEVTDPSIDFFDREAVFIERVLDPLLQRHPGLRVCMEHITTSQVISECLVAVLSRVREAASAKRACQAGSQGCLPKP